MKKYLEPLPGLALAAGIVYGLLRFLIWFVPRYPVAFFVVVSSALFLAGMLPERGTEETEDGHAEKICTSPNGMGCSGMCERCVWYREENNK